MKATGIIRRIDDLGRIVIPKEIRKNLRIKSGENLEIFTNEEENIILKKHNGLNKLKELSQTMTDSINKITKKDIFITNTDQYISVSGTLKKTYQNSTLSNQIINIITSRKNIIEPCPIEINLIENKTEKISYAISPIISEGDALGAIIISSTESITQEDFQIIKIASTFFAKHIEQ